MRTVFNSAVRIGQIPDSWPTIEYNGCLWLPLESTRSPESRGLPGQGAEMIQRWARQGMLWIA
jgi:hypothetical protein